MLVSALIVVAVTFVALLVVRMILDALGYHPHLSEKPWVAHVIMIVLCAIALYAGPAFMRDAAGVIAAIVGIILYLLVRSSTVRG